VETTTVTVTKHRADLAGGIRATMERAYDGATLALDDNMVARLTLTLTPAQLADITDTSDDRGTFLVYRLTHFLATARLAQHWDDAALERAVRSDLTTLRALAAAVQAETECANAAREPTA
jgi:hypothetical protein